MGDASKIEWTDATWTPIRARRINGMARVGAVGWYCEHVTPGCENCYAETMNRRLGTGLSFKPGHRKDVEIFLDDEMLLAPLRWKKPRMIFVCSMTDLFASFVPDEWIDKVFAVMALCPQHTFQLLTKRAERMREYFAAPHPAPNVKMVQVRVCAAIDALVPERHDASRAARHAVTHSWPLPNVWLGVSCERQQEADERIPHLLQTPAAVRFISAEPLLGPIDLSRCGSHYTGSGPLHLWRAGGERKWRKQFMQPPPEIDWVICGGESGHNARPMHPDWARSLRDQCAAAGVPMFFKQWGEHIAETVPGTNVDLRYDLKPNQSVVWGDGKTNHTRYTRVGKKAAGRLLDGKEHNEMPAGAA